MALSARFDLAKSHLTAKQVESSRLALQAIDELIYLHNKWVGRFESPELFFYPTDPYQKWVRTASDYIDRAMNELQ
jgi:hypothetical protein